MNLKQILLVAAPGSETLRQWSAQAQAFDLTMAASDAEALELAQRQHFDLVLADGTGGGVHIGKLQALLPILSDDTALLAYEGEALDALNRRIKAIFDAKKAKRVQRLLILDAAAEGRWTPLPPFSLN